MNEHFTGNGSIYTKKYKPIKIKEVNEELSIYDERDKTLEYMSNYGWENVRGYAWCKETLLKKPNMTKKNAIIKEKIVYEDDVIRNMYVTEHKDIIEISNFVNKTPGSVAYSLESMGIVDRRQLSRGYFKYVFSDLYEKSKITKRDTNIFKNENILALDNDDAERKVLTRDDLLNIKSNIRKYMNS